MFLHWPTRNPVSWHQDAQAGETQGTQSRPACPACGALTLLIIADLGADTGDDPGAGAERAKEIELGMLEPNQTLNLILVLALVLNFILVATSTLTSFLNLNVNLTLNTNLNAM